MTTRQPLSERERIRALAGAWWFSVGRSGVQPEYSAAVLDGETVPTSPDEITVGPDSTWLEMFRPCRIGSDCDLIGRGGHGLTIKYGSAVFRLHAASANGEPQS